MGGFFGDIGNALANIYNGIAGIITIAGAVAVAICSLGMMLAKNQKTVEEFKAWRTRAFITWLVFFMLGTIVSFGQDLTATMSYTP